MDTRHKRTGRRVVTALLLAAGLGGCVYAPPYAAYDPYYYPSYGYPAYVGPPVTLDFGFGYYSHHHHGGGHYGGYGGHGGRGWGHGGRRH
jgi:hypothetical protein